MHTMFGQVDWIIGFIITLGYPLVFSYSDVDRCISRGESEFTVVKNQHCVVKNNVVELACPRSTIIVLSSLNFAVKNTNECTKRVLTTGDFFCCLVQDSDVFYDGSCLQDAWSSEDAKHYREFMHDALKMCTNKSHCVLNSRMFANLQKEIPSTSTHSSYLQVEYQCIKAPTESVQICSSKSMTSKEIHFQHSHSSSTKTNQSCTCRVTSQNNGDFTVRAVDVRTAHNGLILKSDRNEERIPNGRLPLFGFREIFTGQKLDISVQNQSANIDNLWLQISGAYGADVHINCGDIPHDQLPGQAMATFNARSAPRPEVREVAAEDEDNEIGGYWPIVYLAGGAFLTLIPIACIVAGVLIFRYRGKIKDRISGNHTQQGDNPYLDPRIEYHRGPNYQAYGTLVIDVPEHSIAGPPSGHHTLRRVSYHSVRRNPRASMRKSHGPPLVSAPPPPPPPHASWKRRKDNSSRNMGAVPANGVSEFESLMDCDGNGPPVPVRRSSRMSLRHVKSSNPFQAQMHAATLPRKMHAATLPRHEVHLPERQQSEIQIPERQHPEIQLPERQQPEIQLPEQHPEIQQPESPFDFNPRADDEADYFVLETGDSSA